MKRMFLKHFGGDRADNDTKNIGKTAFKTDDPSISIHNEKYSTENCLEKPQPTPKPRPDNKRIFQANLKNKTTTNQAKTYANWHQKTPDKHEPSATQAETDRERGGKDPQPLKRHRTNASVERNKHNEGKASASHQSHTQKKTGAGALPRGTC